MSHVRRKRPREPIRKTQRREKKDRKRQLMGFLVICFIIFGGFATIAAIILAFA